MSHSVSSHLALEIGDYDRLIRRLVPGYEKMQRVLVDGLEAALAAGNAGEGKPLVLDLGGGTGATAAAVAERLSAATVEIWDTDPQMLAVAEQRCGKFGGRVRCVARSFTEPLVACDAVVACIALHHVKDMAAKGRIYRQIHEALRPGGVFINADAAAPSGGWARDFAFGKWISDMGAVGISETQARAYFAQWANEDYYPPLPTELDLLRAAGFREPELLWRDGPQAVFAATQGS